MSSSGSLDIAALGNANGQTLVMGVVNVTPDSFSDGGQWFTHDSAIKHGLELIRQGAAIVDVGGESTRPGASPVGREEEQRRVIPVVTELAKAGAVVSVDTMWSDTAEAALEAGASLINDVSGGRADPQMIGLAADAACPFVVMHWRAHSRTMQDHTDYDNVVADVFTELRGQVDAAIAGGIDPSRIIVDPGLGFSKTGDQNWKLLAELERFSQMGFPLLVAASRKAFLGSLLAESEIPRPADDRDVATAAVSLIAQEAGAWCVRVHDVRATNDIFAVSARLRQEKLKPGGTQ